MTPVLSPVSGSISIILVESGAAVEEGEALAEIELMKALFRVTAPVKGVLKWRCGPGVVVGEGEVIGEIS